MPPFKCSLALELSGSIQDEFYLQYMKKLVHARIVKLVS